MARHTQSVHNVERDTWRDIRTISNNNNNNNGQSNNNNNNSTSWPLYIEAPGPLAHKLALFFNLHAYKERCLLICKCLLSGHLYVQHCRRRRRRCALSYVIVVVVVAVVVM